MGAEGLEPSQSKRSTDFRPTTIYIVAHIQQLVGWTLPLFSSGKFCKITNDSLRIEKTYLSLFICNFNEYGIEDLLHIIYERFIHVSYRK